MCIIAIYDKTNQPNKTTLDRMIKKNADGVGVAWNDGKRVHFRKGLKNSEQVLKIYERVKKSALNFVFHARISTSGGVSAEKCHPFPISDNNKKLNITYYDGTTPCAFHNGIFQLTPLDGLNDTQTLIKTMLAPIFKADANGLYNGDFDRLIDFTTRNNRFVLLYPDKIAAFGTWEEDDDGVKYSNNGFKAFIPTYYSAGYDFPPRGDYGRVYYRDYLNGEGWYED